jgi:hypothetical protein
MNINYQSLQFGCKFYNGITRCFHPFVINRGTISATSYEELPFVYCSEGACPLIQKTEIAPPNLTSELADGTAPAQGSDAVKNICGV